jgi:hypothetical protein
MTMRAGLVALAPDIDLQRLELPPPQSQAVFGQSSFKTIHVSEDENAGIARLFRKYCHFAVQPATPKYARGLAIPVWFCFADSDVLFLVDNEVAFMTGA